MIRVIVGPEKNINDAPVIDILLRMLNKICSACKIEKRH